jgi:hypothetical protein
MLPHVAHFCVTKPAAYEVTMLALLCTATPLLLLMVACF